MSIFCLSYNRTDRPDSSWGFDSVQERSTGKMKITSIFIILMVALTMFLGSGDAAPSPAKIDVKAIKNTGKAIVSNKIYFVNYRHILNKTTSVLRILILIGSYINIQVTSTKTTRFRTSICKWHTNTWSTWGLNQLQVAFSGFSRDHLNHSAIRQLNLFHLTILLLIDLNPFLYYCLCYLGNMWMFKQSLACFYFIWLLIYWPY